MKSILLIFFDKMAVVYNILVRQQLYPLRGGGGTLKPRQQASLIFQHSVTSIDHLLFIRNLI
jgi:hypothetical protein